MPYQSRELRKKMLEDLPGNSHKVSYEKKEPPAPANQPAEETEPVVLGKVVRRRPPLGKRLLKMFFSGDSDSVMSYVVGQVLVPALQDLFTDMVNQTIQKAVYGSVRPGTGYRAAARSTSAIGRPVVSYNQFGPGGTRPTPAVAPARPPVQQQPHERIPIDELVLEDRIDAENVLIKLMDAVQQYGQATLGQLYRETKQPSVYTDHRWGWTNLDAARVVRVAGGYMFDLPPIEDLGR